MWNALCNKLLPSVGQWCYLHWPWHAVKVIRGGCGDHTFYLISQHLQLKASKNPLSTNKFVLFNLKKNNNFALICKHATVLCWYILGVLSI